MKKMILLVLCMAGLYSAQAQPTGNGDRPEPPTVKKRIENLFAELDKNKVTLTDTEKQKVTEAYTAFFEEADKLHTQGGKPDRDAMDALHKKRTDVLAKVLSAEKLEQLKKVDEALRPKPPGGKRQ